MADCVDEGWLQERGSLGSRGCVELLMLISLHLPKTAGTSFLVALKSYFGQSLMEDYGDHPLHKGTSRRNFHAVHACLRNAFPPSYLKTPECIHGHFLPLKYILLNLPARKRYVVWMRDPVERLASHYFYWTRNYDPHNAGLLHRKVVEENWTLERFCLGPEMRNTYSKFLWGFPLSRFDFIGITEFYDTEIEQFSRRILGASMDNQQKNVSPHGVRHAHVQERDLRCKIETHHQVDMALYRRALQLREKRMIYPGQC